MFSQATWGWVLNKVLYGKAPPRGQTSLALALKEQILTENVPILFNYARQMIAISRTRLSTLHTF